MRGWRAVLPAILLFLVGLAGPAVAHHGYAWLDPRLFVLEGVVEEVALGNPHGHLMVRAADGVWEVELSDVAGHLRIGFTADSVAVGDAITVTGYRSRDPTLRLMRGDRLKLRGTTYDIFPGSIFAPFPDPQNRLGEALITLQEWPVAQVIRDTRYAYPLINVLHIFGFILLIGGILPVDLRLLGAFPGLPPAALGRVLEPMAAIGLGLAIATGLLLFAVKPVVYAQNPAFLAKMVLVAIGTAHALQLRFGGAWRLAMAGGPVGPLLRTRAAFSLTLWIAVLLAGRFIAFVPTG